MKDSEKGFTLVELLVSLFVIALITALFLANYRSGQREREVIATGEKLVNGLREVQNMTIHRVNLTESDSGYGAYFNLSAPDRYLIFKDANNDRLYQAGELTRTVMLGGETKLESIAPAGVSGQLEIFFLAPNPTLYINGASTPAAAASIILRHNQVDFQKTVFVGGAGGKIYLD